MYIFSCIHADDAVVTFPSYELQHLPATATETLPFLTLPEQELLQTGRHKIYVKLHRHPNIILVRNHFI